MPARKGNLASHMCRPEVYSWSQRISVRGSVVEPSDQMHPMNIEAGKSLAVMIVND